MTSNTVTVDDNDPRITYSGPWILGGNASVEFDGTTHRTLTAGATATFTFLGTLDTFSHVVGMLTRRYQGLLSPFLGP